MVASAFFGSQVEDTTVDMQYLDGEDGVNAGSCVYIGDIECKSSVD